MRVNKGITLVALVMTVIVLLLLAGVALSLVAGKEGLLDKTKEASEKYNNAVNNEKEALNGIILNLEGTKKLVSDGSFSNEKGVNTPDTSKLPKEKIKYVTWSETAPYAEELFNTLPIDWYDYSNSKWANIKTTSTDGSLEAYWVWIPRFAYKLPESNTAKTIEVAFIKDKGTIVINPTTGAEEQSYYATDTSITTDGSGIYVKKTGEAASKWIIHPAFSFGNSAKLNENTQLAGIWVAKYEASSSNPSESNGGGNTPLLKVQVKPNVKSWRNITAANSFTVCRGIQNTGGALGTITGVETVDTHMMKNMEWGAVSVLSKSKYGNYDKVTHTSTQVWNNPNSSYITGTSGATKDLGSIVNGSCYEYNTINGVKASTTGNITGVYDMAGGAFEQVAGILSGKQLDVLGTTVAKYYDSYTNQGNVQTDYEGGRIGDLTRELLPASQLSWDKDLAVFVYSVSPLMYRGGSAVNTDGSGIFAFSRSDGAIDTRYSFRPTLVII